MFRMPPASIASALTIILMEIPLDRQSATETLDGFIEDKYTGCRKHLPLI
jgi:hypothetical protein